MFLDHTPSFWGVIAALAYDALTAALIVAAVKNYRAVVRQTLGAKTSASEQVTALKNTAREQLEEAESARKDALLPWLIGASGERWTSGHSVVVVRNVGPGPAIDCKVEIGTERMDGGPDDLYERQRVRALIEASNPLNRQTEFDAIEAGGSREITYKSDSLDSYAGWKLGVCRATFFDVYRRAHEVTSYFQIEPVGK